MTEKCFVFQTNKQRYSTVRVVEHDEPNLKGSQVRVKIDRFAFTANNITYAVLGERLQYWAFFPIESGDEKYWGVIPVWGFADVIESNVALLPVGERLFGYFPPASTLVMTPGRITPGSVIETSEHRRALPPGYNSYQRVSSNYDRRKENELMVFFPLFVTGYCLHNMLSKREWYKAEQIIIISASSKTSISLGYALAGDNNAPKIIGLTSQRNLKFIQSLNLYDESISYDAITDVDAYKSTVIVDMSGNSEILSGLHSHLAQNMHATINVGITHWGELSPVNGIVTERCEMFFAPAYIQKLIEELGFSEYQKRTTEFVFTTSKKVSSWMSFKEVDGLNGLQANYNDVCSGQLAPDISITVEM